MQINSGFRLAEPAGDIVTSVENPTPGRATPFPTSLRTGWTERDGVERSTFIRTSSDALRIETHEIPALIEVLTQHLATIDTKGGIQP